jgi:proteasome accessory factor B
MADVSQVERQLYILSLLSENRRGYTLDEIMHSLQRIGIDVSRKTAQRDLDYITANFFIYEEERNAKTYYISDKYNVGSVSFTIMEVISLYFSREILQPYANMDVGATSLRILNKIIENAPKINKSYIKTLEDVYRINVPSVAQDKELSPEYLNTIRDAVAYRKTLAIEYYSFNSNKTTQREFDPYFLEIQEGRYHLIGFCHLRCGIRDLRVARITNVEMMDKAFTRPENFYEDFTKNRFDKLVGEKRINMRLKFKGEAARYVKEYEAGRADKIDDCDDGQIVFERVTTLTPEVVKWILGFGGNVEVVEPLELKEKVVEEARRILGNY